MSCATCHSDRRIHAVGLCRPCYRKHRLQKMTPASLPWHYVRKDDLTGCWTWNGCLTAEGYGKVTYGSVHRVFYEVLRERPTPGMHLDHLCKNRACVNPDHLEEVTPAENIRRSPTASTINAQKTECVRGHAFDEQNTRVLPNGRRMCKECRRLACERYRQTRPAASRGPALLVPCPTCGAAVGEHCTSMTGRKSSQPHMARVQSAEAVSDRG